MIDRIGAVNGLAVKRHDLVAGVEALSGAPIMASDLRAGAALLIAALAAKGRTTIQRVYHIDRGYESVERKLERVGARVERVK